jgi:L-ascorbate metabolism protein UlaG (beta-lactamase superfamily)
MKTAVILLAGAAVAFCIDQADIFSTDLGPVNTTPIYNTAMMIEGAGKVIQVDPASQANYKGLPKADLVLITLDDPEHLDPTAIAKISKKNTAIICPSGPAGKLQHATGLSYGETVGFGDISIQAVPSYNVAPEGSDQKPLHAKGQGNGYILTYPGLRLYISGDTSLLPELTKLKKIDVAFISVGAPGTLTTAEAADLIKALKPHVVYPNHYLKANPDDIKAQMTTPGVEIRKRYWY